MKKKILFLILAISLALSMCACAPVPDDNTTDEPDAEYWIDGFHLDLVGRSEITGIRFYLYREPATDVIYIYEANHGGVTPLVNPETGLPMTYAQYAALTDKQAETNPTKD